MEPINLTPQEFYLYSLILNTGLGFLFGLIPLVTGFVKHQRKYGFFGLVLSVVGGAILGIFLAVPVAAVFTWLVLRRAAAGKVSSGDDAPIS